MSNTMDQVTAAKFLRGNKPDFRITNEFVSFVDYNYRFLSSSRNRGMVDVHAKVGRHTIIIIMSLDLDLMQYRPVPAYIDKPVLTVLLWAIGELLCKMNELPPHVKIRHNGRCAHCGRRLTDPLSVERGFGPVCYKNQ